LIFFWYGAAAAYNYGLRSLIALSFPASVCVGDLVIGRCTKHCHDAAVAIVG